MKKHHITLTVNGDEYDALVEPHAATEHPRAFRCWDARTIVGHD